MRAMYILAVLLIQVAFVMLLLLLLLLLQSVQPRSLASQTQPTPARIAFSITHGEGRVW